MKDRVDSTNDSFKDLPGFIEKSMVEWGVPGLAVTVVREDEVIYLEGFGYRDTEKRLPVTPGTLFAIGSCTKPFTAASVAMLVDEKKLDWHTPVIEYLPDFRLYDDYATIHTTPCDLLCHRTGLPRYDILAFLSYRGRDEIYKRLRYLQPSTGFREFFQYNSMMYIAAGILVGRVSGGTWEEFVADRIFKPLGMKTSNFSVTDSQKSDDFALPYAETDGKPARIPFLNIDVLGPGGSINSSIEEMSRWLMVHIGNDNSGSKGLISAKSLAQMQMPHMAIHPERDAMCSLLMEQGVSGMGWFISNYRGFPMIFHGGDINGFSALTSFLPGEKTGVVVLTNTVNMLPYVVSRTIYDRLLGLEDFEWNSYFKKRFKKIMGTCGSTAIGEKAKPGTRPSLPLNDYTGAYEHPGFGCIQLETCDDRLEGTLSGLNFQLEHYHFDVFRITDSILKGTKVCFHLSSDGEVKILSLPLEQGVPDFVFEHIPAKKV
jgi:CubicO group peptidase (beta-lactamase class C family)